MDARRVRRAGGGDVCARAARRQHADQPRARVRHVDPVCAERGRADLLRRTTATRAGGRTRRRGAGVGWRRLPGHAAKPSGDAVHARRIGRVVARRDARHPVRRVGQRLVPSRPCRSPASPAPSSPQAIVYWLATRPGRPISTSVLLLAGVTLNSFFSALILFAQFLSDYAQVYRAARWLMGDLDVGGFTPARRAPACRRRVRRVCVAARVAESAQPRADAAAARGVDVARTQRLAFISASLATCGRGVAGRTDRLRRDRRPAPRSTAGRRRSPDRPAGLSALRCVVPRHVRPGRPHAARAGRDPGRCGHRDDWRAVLLMAAGTPQVDPAWRRGLARSVRARLPVLLRCRCCSPRS